MREVSIGFGVGNLGGILEIPKGARGVILFAHGSGSGRFSPRNQFVARELNRQGFATLLLDLLTESESNDRGNVFDIDLLADRLIVALNWAGAHEELRNLEAGFFGASTGAGAALKAAAREPSKVQAVVSRGGRPDLAGAALLKVRAPTLLIVGGNDGPVIGMNESAYDRLTCEKQIEIVPRAGHLFEEPGTLEIVADLAADWFTKHIGSKSKSSLAEL